METKEERMTRDGARADREGVSLARNDICSRATGNDGKGWVKIWWGEWSGVSESCDETNC